MTYQEKEEAIRVAQVTYLLEGGPKERMVVVIPRSWVKDFPHYDYVADIDVVTPVVITRNAFVEAIRQEMDEMNAAAKRMLNRQLCDDARVGTTQKSLWTIVKESLK